VCPPLAADVPEGIDDGEYAGKVLNLDRALYGLKQAGRV
jgi:hypothetical protein